MYIAMICVINFKKIFNSVLIIIRSENEETIPKIKVKVLNALSESSAISSILIKVQ